MDEVYRQAVMALRGMWQYRWFGMAVCWTLGIAGIVAIMLIPSKYEASARMFVNTESILKPLMAGMTVAPDINQRIEILSRVLVSRPNVEKLVRIANASAKSEDKSPEELDKQIDDLIKDLRIKGAGRDQIYTITLRDRDPTRAKRLVEHFSTLFIESGQGNRDVDTNVAKKFIDQQIEIYEKRLEEAETQLKNFKSRYLGMSPGEGKDYFARMSDARSQLEKAQLELREAEQSRDALRQRLTTLEVADSASPSGSDPRADIDSRIESMKRDLAILMQKYTEAHPDVVGMRRVLKDMEAQRAQMSPSPRNNPASTSVAMGQINVSLAQAEANIASLRARVTEYSAREGKLKESAMLVPQLEAEFAQLNRDYDINKKSYESLIQRRESVSLSGDMQSVSGVGDFKLVDPPRVSPRPVAPNRPLLLVLSLALAIGAGAASAYSATTLRKSFYDARGLREATGLPILGTVMKAGGGSMTPARKKRMVQFFAGLGGLGAIYAAAIVISFLSGGAST